MAKRSGGTRRAEAWWSRPSADAFFDTSLWQTQRLWQLPLGLSVAIIAIAILVIDHTLFASWPLSVGVGVVLVLTVVAFALPSGGGAPRYAAIIPFLDIIAVGIMGQGLIVRFGFLWVFPLAWIASSYATRWVVAALGEIALLLILDALLGLPNELALLRMMVVLLGLAFIAMTIRLYSRRNDEISGRLREKGAELEATLERVSAQNNRFSQMLNGLQDAVARVGGDGRIVEMNSAFSDLFCVDESGVPLSVQYDVRQGIPHEPAMQLLPRAARGDLLDGETLWLLDCDSRWHALSAWTRALDDDPNEANATLLVVRDVTPEVEAVQARRDLSATVTHELANPLTAIVGFTDMLLESELPGNVHDKLESIDIAAQRIERLIADVRRSVASSQPIAAPGTLGEQDTP